jgi:hypothetical protein
MEQTNKVVGLNILAGSVLALISLFTATANAYTFVPEVGVNVEQHSNITKSDAEIDDVVVAPFLGFEFINAGPVIDSKINFMARHEDYQDDTYDATNFFDVVGFVDWKLVPQRLHWAFEDFANTQRINALDTANPDNLQTINVFSTGPDLLFQRGVWSLIAKYRYSDVSYSETEDDSTVHSGSLALQRELNAYSRVEGGVIYRVNDYTHEIEPNYDITNGFLGYFRELPSGRLLTRLGYSSVNIDEGDRSDEPYVKLVLSYQPFSSLTLDLLGGHEFTDAAGEAYDATTSRISSSEPAAMGLNVASTTSPGVYKDTSGTLRGTYQPGGLISGGFSIFGSNKEYLENPAQDADDLGGSLFVDLALTRFLSFGIGGSLQITDFTDTNETVDYSSAFAALNYRITRNLFSTLGVSTETRDSDLGLSDYTDDVVYLSLRYKKGSE